MSALPSPIVTPSRWAGLRPSCASEALLGTSRLAGRLSASGLFGRLAVEPALSLFQPPARRSAREAGVDARAHAFTPSVLTVRGNRALLPSVVATSADLPNLAGAEV